MQMQARRCRIPAGTIELEAVLHLPSLSRPPSLLVVCHPHPLYGGSMDNNVVYAVCEAALQEGMAALRFNFRGVGASQGSHGGGEPEVDDALAVLEFAAAQPGGETLNLAGYSFGARVAALASSRAAAAPHSLVLISPPIRAASGSVDLGTAPLSQLWITGDRDAVCPASELESLAAGLGAQVSVSVVEGADHSWLGYEADLRDIAGGFLRWHAGPSQ